MLCGILNQTHVANSHSALSQLSLVFSGKCVFDKEMRFVTSKTHFEKILFLARWVKIHDL